MKLHEIASRCYWRDIARWYVPRIEPIGCTIAARFTSMIRSGRAHGYDDDIAESAAVGMEISRLSERALNNEPYLRPGMRVMPRFSEIVLERQIEYHVHEIRFTPNLSIPVTQVCRDRGINQNFFWTVVQGRARLLPMDREFFPVCRG